MFGAAQSMLAEVLTGRSAMRQARANQDAAMQRAAAIRGGNTLSGFLSESASAPIRLKKPCKGCGAPRWPSRFCAYCGG